MGESFDSGWQQEANGLWTRRLRLPPGWAGPFHALVLPYLGWLARRAPLPWNTLVLTYPHYLPLARILHGKRLVYYCLDDYRLYWPRRAVRVERQEIQLVSRADLTLCIAHYRVKDLKERVTSARNRIYHLPLGVSEDFLISDLSNHPGPLPRAWGPIPRPVVGYVGTLGDRVDWRLVHQVACGLPRWNFVFVGTVPKTGSPSAGGARPDWFQDFRRARSLPNVHFPGPVKQETVGRINQSFDICWIPYATDHRFNRAACPTKIMDYLGSGRPIVSTDLPECLLYEDVIHIGRGSHDIREKLLQGLQDTPPQREARLRMAREHTWEKIAERFCHLLKGVVSRP